MMQNVNVTKRNLRKMCPQILRSALVVLALGACQERDLRIHLEDADGHRDAGRYEEAINEYRQALAIDSTNVKLFNSAGFLHIRLGRVDSAMKYYRAALRADSTAAESYYNLGVLFFSIEEFDRARRAAGADAERPALEPHVA